jgi:hypothetical protein
MWSRCKRPSPCFAGNSGNLALDWNRAHNERTYFSGYRGEACLAALFGVTRWQQRACGTGDGREVAAHPPAAVAGAPRLSRRTGLSMVLPTRRGKRSEPPTNHARLERRSSEMWNRRLQRVQAIVERQQRVPAGGNDDRRLVFDRQWMRRKGSTPWPPTSASPFRCLIGDDFRVLPARFDAARQNVVLMCSPGRGMLQESDCGSDLAWREHCYRRCGTMPKAVRRNPVSEFLLGPVSYQLGDSFRWERATTRFEPERIMLVHFRKGRPHLG